MMMMMMIVDFYSSLRIAPLLLYTLLCILYSVSQKETSPTFLAVTRESIVGFS